ncbi:MAG: MFS transporter [Micromonosporaceae bacterium]|nr:MFS transporter [Micromonosporaceae bacterium]
MSDKTTDRERSATFREVFAGGEFRGVYSAGLLSWLGDYLAKAAVTAMVYNQTHSVAFSAAAFAVGYLPWVVGGPVLAALAERYPHRRVMVSADLARAVLIALVAIPHLPTAAIFTLLFCTALGSPPFDAARSALMPRILQGDRYVVALTIQNVTMQAAQLVGYFGGAGLGTAHPQLALLIDSATFLASALVLRSTVASHRPGLAPERRTHLLREAAGGFGVVFRTGVLRSIAVLVFALMLFTTVPEGLAAAWAAVVTGDNGQRGMAQGLIMVGYPAGFIVGGLVIGRLVSPASRRRLVRPLGVVAPLVLVPALFDPSAIVICGMCVLAGFAAAGLMPTANHLFVQALPDAYRARAFGVMQSGVLVLQGIGVAVTGELADNFYLPSVVGVWSLAGVVLMLAVSVTWPPSERFTEAIEAAQAANAVSTDEPTDEIPKPRRAQTAEA